MKHKYTACPRRILTLLVTLTGVITTGCVTEYDRDDIAEYVRGLGVDGVVSDSYTVVEDERATTTAIGRSRSTMVSPSM